jgi:hypothetical protein
MNKILYLTFIKFDIEKDRWFQVEKDDLYYNISDSTKELIENSLENDNIKVKIVKRLNELKSIDYCVIIAFLSMRDLNRKTVLNSLVNTNNELSKIRFVSKNENNTQTYYSQFPMIAIGSEDIFISNEEKINKGIIDFHTSLNFDPRYAFWDSSIWNRYVPLFPYSGTYEDKLKDIFKEIFNNLLLGIYWSNISLEFIEFQSRMMINSYLIGSGGHSLTVTPYNFHSETIMNKMALGLSNFNKRKNESSPKWNILLLDDFGAKSLEFEKEIFDIKNFSLPTKKDIIENIFRNSYLSNSIVIRNVKIINEEKSSIIQSAFDMVLNDEIIYDIIFLDFLLEPINDKPNKRYYGTEFLKKIKDCFEDENLIYRTPIANKFWIFPISVFSEAIFSDLRKEGFSFFEEEWYLNRGADPVNTPKLFLYYISRFLSEQYKFHNFSIKFIMYKFVDANKKEVNEIARKNFPKIAEQYGNLESLRNKTGKSLLILHILRELGKQIAWDHVYHFMYLLAYGTKIDLPELWEELSIIKRILMQNYSSNSKIEDKKLNDSIKLLEEYISDQLN